MGLATELRENITAHVSSSTAPNVIPRSQFSLVILTQQQVTSHCLTTQRFQAGDTLVPVPLLLLLNEMELGDLSNDAAIFGFREGF